MKNLGLWLSLLGLVFWLSACVRKPEIKPELAYPAHFPAPVFKAWTPEGEALGKRLFYDRILSLDHSLSCGSCHHPAQAFADLPDRRVSMGVGGALGRRQSPPMFNLAWQPHFMWDGGITHLEVMPLAPITEPHEMALDLAEAVRRLNADLGYRREFRQVFGEDTINSRQLFLALHQFMEALISANSPYDRYLQGQSEALDAAQKRGLGLFERHCASCHSPPLMSNFGFADNGLADSGDEGRYQITLEQGDKGKFKIPALRNLSFTPPYMHDGSLPDLEAVLAHYSEGINPKPNLDTRLPAGGLQLQAQEKADLLAFLRALDDVRFIQNPAFRPD